MWKFQVGKGVLVGGPSPGRGRTSLGHLGQILIHLSCSLASYLWNLVDVQDSCHVEAYVGVGPPNDCYWIVVGVTFIVRNETVPCGKKFH